MSTQRIPAAALIEGDVVVSNSGRYDVTSVVDHGDHVRVAFRNRAAQNYAPYENVRVA